MHPKARLEKLRSIRNRPAKEVAISRTIAGIADHAERTHKRLGELVALWEEVVPAELAAHTSISGLRSGVLHVVVDSSSVAFELDRQLRGGLADELRRRFRGTLIRVKTRKGRVEDSQR